MYLEKGIAFKVAYAACPSATGNCNGLDHHDYEQQDDTYATNIV